MIAKLAAEGLGTAFLLIGVVGSGIMGAALARGFTDMFAGIYPGHVAMFIVMQIIAAGIGHVVLRRLFA